MSELDLGPRYAAGFNGGFDAGLEEGERRTATEIKRLQAEAAEMREALEMCQRYLAKHHDEMLPVRPVRAEHIPADVVHIRAIIDAIHKALSTEAGKQVLDVVRAAQKFDECMTEFDGDESCCGEAMEWLFKTVEALAARGNNG